MKKVVLALSLVFILCSISTAEIKDSPNGFRGIKLGDPPSALGTREKVEADGFVSLYEKKDDKMAIGVTDLASIRYLFLQDRLLMAIFIKTGGRSNSDQLRDTAIARYGEPAKNAPDDCLWFDDNVIIGYKYDKYENVAELVIYSKEIYDRYNAVKKLVIEQGVKDF